VSRFLALLGVLQQPGKTQEGMQALVRLLAPDTTVQVSPYCLRPVEIEKPLGFYGDEDFCLMAIRLWVTKRWMRAASC
jgi:type VI secretion system protein ImpH